MKALPIFLGLLVSGSASAGLIQCESQMSLGDKYLLVLDTASDKGAIFSTGESGYGWKLDYADARVVMAMDGGPINVIGTDNSKTNWKQTDSCYKIKNATMRFTINLSSTGGTGVLQRMPNVDIKPNVMCAPPCLALPAPLELVCRELN